MTEIISSRRGPCSETVVNYVYSNVVVSSWQSVLTIASNGFVFWLFIITSICTSHGVRRRVQHTLIGTVCMLVTSSCDGVTSDVTRTLAAFHTVHAVTATTTRRLAFPSRVSRLAEAPTSLYQRITQSISQSV